ncbi:MAG TPA: DUF1501 domain-containing protein [Phycisphaerales bacterium]
MDLHNSPAFTRRSFLTSGLTLASTAWTIPAFLGSSADAMAKMLGAGLSSAPGVDDDRILVVIQLSGGNDGLNTVIPFGMGEYYKARGGIGVKADQVLKLSGADGVGLHPRMTALKELFDEGMLSVVQGVGYPNPNRSHFKSMDIWQTADTDATGDGWLGRYYDSECCGYGKGESGQVEKSDKPASMDPAISIGRNAPLALQGRSAKPVAFESAELFRWSGEDIHEALREPYHDLNRRGSVEGSEGGNTNADFLMRTALDAQISSEKIRKAVAQKPLVGYPGNELGRQLQMVGSMIRAGLKTRVYYVTLGGFDTHSGQGGAQGRHGNLLANFADSLRAFYKDLKAQNNDGRVLTVTFSEFGRRVAQNASGGTDHGTAAPMFICGPMIRPGVIGDHPSLNDLDQGDLKYKIDFRSVYAGVLEQWLQADSKKVLGGTYKPVVVLKA